MVGEENASDREVIDVAADSVAVRSVTDESVSFYFEGGVPVPCYEFEKAQVDRRGRTVGVKVRARRTATYCVQVVGRLRKVPLEIGVHGEGARTFAFWRGDEADPLTVEVDVP